MLNEPITRHDICKDCTSEFFDRPPGINWYGHGVKDTAMRVRKLRKVSCTTAEKRTRIYIRVVETFQESCKSIITMMNFSYVIRCWRRSTAFGAKRGGFQEVASLSLFSFANLCL
ncbi:hypothetical protein Ddye_014247 [Dipteronia dyeriana]|uniref:Uncharacterized protein n=1 Tax=Dipteronia dyeriana TaxID=168575 RepID=A0AAD9X7K0_9ROSI|nr:hypothetical protein Ddye_014247 [Dipteronia dyeriana]